ncbi:MAG TPA: heavy metal translocating P-type ATPase [Candidatus Rifleibacterium sp.]|nr:heavy metal translocating P-type ATPase [Candidatus Rifleibacterium sp.]
MSCTNCSRGIESKLSQTDGIYSAQVYLADESAEIIYDPEKTSPDAICSLINNIGYQARTTGATPQEETGIKSLVFTALLAIPVAYLAMFMPDTSANRFVQMILSGLILLTTGRRFFTGAVRSLQNRSTNMDVLVALGIGTAWSYSTAVLIFSTSMGHHGMIHFEAAAMLALFITAGKMLESMARREASSSLRSLTSLLQSTAHRITSENTIEDVSIEQVEPGDTLVVKPGERFPTDGEIISGESSADESLMTGESMPVNKSVGSRVISGSINLTGELQIKATRRGSESTLQSLIRTMRRAQADKPKLQRFADRASDFFVPIVMSLSALTFIGWLVAGAGLNTALMHAVSVLVVACPCALGLATPTAIVVASGIAMRKGLLVKKTSSLEALSDIRFILLDKTGTLTAGKPVVEMVVWRSSSLQQRFTNIISDLASRSLHPLSHGIHLKLGKDPQSDQAENLANVEERRGFGITGTTATGKKILLGSAKLIEASGQAAPPIPDDFIEKAVTTVFAAVDSEVVAIFGLGDLPQPGAREAVAALKDRGIEPVIVSGDRAAPVKAVAETVGILTQHAETLPVEKLNILKSFINRGPTAFVGDGINDAPALSAASVGIALGSGADAAQEAVDLVMMRHDLALIPFAIDLSRATIAKIRQNLVWAVAYNLLTLPLAAGILEPFWGPGYTLTPAIAGAAMAMSSISVVINSLTLRFIKGA